MNKTDVSCHSKEIHAYQNIDGTYRVEIIEKNVKVVHHGHTPIKETADTRIDIERADIQIRVYKSDKDDGELLTIEVK